MENSSNSTNGSNAPNNDGDGGGRISENDKNDEDEGIKIVCEVITIDDDVEVEAIYKKSVKSSSTCKPPPLPKAPSRFITRFCPMEHSEVFALRTSDNHSCYRRSEVIRRAGPPFLYGVNYTLTVRFDAQGQEEDVFSKNIAYSETFAFKMDAGLRIVGRRENCKKCPAGTGSPCYLPGIIIRSDAVFTAEDKYLVLFDNGEAGYVLTDDIHLMCSGNIEDFYSERSITYPETIEFIRDYVIQTSKPYPWLLSRKYNGGLIPVRRDGKWRIARVIRDLEYGQVTKVEFEDSGAVEHIFIGSPRFYPVYSEYYRSMGKAEDKAGLDSCLGHAGIVVKVKMENSISPFGKPFLSKWNYDDGINLSRSRWYFAPGNNTRRIRNHEQLTQHLMKTNSALHSNLFCFKGRIRISSIFQPDNVHQRIRDISYGKENVPVECVNSVDDDTLPNDFKYETKCSYSPTVKGIDEADPFIMCCDCTDDCMDKLKCACWRRPFDDAGCAVRRNHSRMGYNNRKLEYKLDHGIYECNSRCKCRKETCPNRVVQNGLQWPLQVFRTKTKGWGVRAKCDIPKGYFVSTYAGEIITDEEADAMGSNKDKYFFEINLLNSFITEKPDYESDVTDIENDDYDDELSLVEGQSDVGKKRKRLGRGGKSNRRERKLQRRIEMYDTFIAKERAVVINPMLKGNVGRFYSHSCDPNMFIQNVFVDTHDFRFPVFAFFTQKDVLAGSELTWNYGYELDADGDMSIQCHCGTPSCRGRLL